MISVGQRLRTLRDQLGFTIRDVESASQRLAAKHKNDDFIISVFVRMDVKKERRLSQKLISVPLPLNPPEGDLLIYRYLLSPPRLRVAASAEQGLGGLGVKNRVLRQTPTIIVL